ncbi:type VI secretion system Vgr family protein [Polyangium mundeleinium]|uniref:Type VI secretion system tip protein TssI/VgrG n=1 Tax=Polyangium mundeleinium TaxID=2995306 RepID=A0ABT5F1L6_9BACT|nr:type VI secretion system tip protein TssI/VgrG [Polyangium mundeleinium]MDC0747519.1 type VI secretion system tip protein TssI/VgrG [Polyangium mundeleinium]
MSKKALRIEVFLSLGDASWPALRLRVEEGLSELGGAWVEVAVGSDLDVEELLEEPATVVILWDGQEKRRFSMQLARGRFLDEKDGHLHYELELRPSLWFLGLDKNTRKWRDQPAEPIVSKVLDEGSVPHAWRTTRASASQPYCVQYRETNLDFVSRMLEFEGFYYSFDPDGTMIIGDTSSASEEVLGGAEFELIEAAGALSHGDFGVTSFERGAVVGSGKATVNDHNWKTPKLSLLASATGAKDTHLEVYDYPVGYRDVGTGEMLAKLRVEALCAEKRFVEGTSTVFDFAPARIFSFTHEEGASFSGRYLLVSVEHEYREEAGVAHYENRFRAIPADVPFRPAVKTERPEIEGNHTVMVRGPAGEEIHTDAYGRAKVQFHWDREAKGTDEDSRWIRMAQEISTSIALARVGWEISVGYIDGDPTRPVGFARQINGQMVPMYSQPAFKNRMTIRTETYPGKAGFNELRLEDSAGSMHMDWHAQKDFKTLVQHDRTETIGNNQTVLIESNSTRTVEKNQTIDIGGDQTRTVGRHVVHKVNVDRNHTIGGEETIDVTLGVETSVMENDVETVGGTRFTRSGNDETGSIDRSVQKTLTRIVGGSSISMAGGSVAHEGGEMLFEYAGGSKITIGLEESVKQAVAENLDTFVSGFDLRKSKGDMSVSAKQTTVNVQSSAFFRSAERMELRSRAIELVSSASIALRAGALSIEMTPGNVTITGPLKQESETKITLRGNPEKLTP